MNTSKDKNLVVKLYDYALANKGGWRLFIKIALCLALIGASLVYYRTHCINDTDKTLQTIIDVFISVCFSISTGFLTVTLFSVWQDFSLRTYIDETYSDYGFSSAVGTKLYPDHNSDGIPKRSDLINQLLNSGSEFKLLTTTADSYLLKSENRQALEMALQRGAKLKLLLHTPLFFMRDYMGTGPEDHKLESAARFGQHHIHSSGIIQLHRDEIIPAIQKLQDMFPRQVEVRFFVTRHAVNLAIYDKFRIFGAPLLGKSEGKNLPCIEVFPGLTQSKAYSTFESEFKLLWEDDKLILNSAQVSDIYEKIITEASEEYANHKFSEKTDNFVRELAKAALDENKRKHHII